LYQDHYVQSFTALAPAWGWEYQPYTYGLAEVRRFQEGSLVLEVLDPGNRQLIWQAVAEGALTGLRDPQEADARVRLAVQRMLARDSRINPSFAYFPGNGVDRIVILGKVWKPTAS
jgi:hypothetical protein